MRNNQSEPFEKLTDEETERYMAEGKAIYSVLRSIYKNNTDQDFNNILHVLCIAMLFLIKNNVEKDNQKVILQIIWRILNSNIEMNE